jgi:hypothetical protein
MIDSEDEIAALGRMVACGRESLMILFRASSSWKLVNLHYTICDTTPP